MWSSSRIHLQSGTFVLLEKVISSMSQFDCLETAAWATSMRSAQDLLDSLGKALEDNSIALSSNRLSFLQVMLRDHLLASLPVTPKLVTATCLRSAPLCSPQ